MKDQDQVLEDLVIAYCHLQLLSVMSWDLAVLQIPGQACLSFVQIMTKISVVDFILL